MNYCPNCQCYECQIARDNEKEAEFMQSTMKSWDWNATSREVALFIKGSPIPADRWFMAIREYFNQGTYFSVVDSYEKLT